MNTITTTLRTTRGTQTRPRVWLVGRVGTTPDPADLPTVRDTRMRTWQPGDDGRYHSADGWHHATWTELHSRYDLVEVTGPPLRN